MMNLKDGPKIWIDLLEKITATQITNSNT